MCYEMCTFQRVWTTVGYIHGRPLSPLADLPVVQSTNLLYRFWLITLILSHTLTISQIFRFNLLQTWNKIRIAFGSSLVSLPFSSSPQTLAGKRCSPCERHHLGRCPTWTGASCQACSSWTHPWTCLRTHSDPTCRNSLSILALNVLIVLSEGGEACLKSTWLEQMQVNTCPHHRIQNFRNCSTAKSFVIHQHLGFKKTLISGSGRAYC